ncbi:hypothetical protein MBT84_08925 [Streptomyces sp. MBT84]|nr:hypothetical protein [Streptomyces sp. MBT84]
MSRGAAGGDRDGVGGGVHIAEYRQIAHGQPRLGQSAPLHRPGAVGGHRHTRHQSCGARGVREAERPEATVRGRAEPGVVAVVSDAREKVRGELGVSMPTRRAGPRSQ